MQRLTTVSKQWHTDACATHIIRLVESVPGVAIYPNGDVVVPTGTHEITATWLVQGIQTLLNRSCGS